MKMTDNFIVLNMLKWGALVLGYFAALSLVRSFSAAFDWYAGRVYGNLLNVGLYASVLFLMTCLTVFALSVWCMTPSKISAHKNPFPVRKMDYTALVLLCIVGFLATAQMLVGNVNTSLWRQLLPTTQVASMIFYPAAAYILSMFAYGELVARLRDNTLVSTLYWVKFFSLYPVWRLAGFFAAIVLATQLYLVGAYLISGNISSFANATAMNQGVHFIPVPGSIMTMETIIGQTEVFVSDSFVDFNIANFDTNIGIMEQVNQGSLLLIPLIVLLAATYFAAFILNLSQDYSRANAEKIKAERFKSELITNVSHDIKTPLTSIINYVDLLKSEVVQGKPVEYVQVLDRKSARLRILIDDLMEASKASTGNLRVDWQDINLSELIGQVAGEFEDIFAEKGLQLVLRQPDSAVWVRTDSRHLCRILENLFSNAGKYALGGTRVFADITLAEKRDSQAYANDGIRDAMRGRNNVRIVIQNTSAEPVEFSDGEATQEFMRGDRARSTEGSGLGLYIAKSLAEILGGQLKVEVLGDLFRVEVVIEQ